MGKGGGHPQQETWSQKDAPRTETDCNEWQSMLRKEVLAGLFHPKKCWFPFSTLELWCGDVRPVWTSTASLNSERYILNVHLLTAIQAWWPVRSASPLPLMGLYLPRHGRAAVCLCLGSTRVSVVASELFPEEQLVDS